jgi:hypothetical protein
VQVSASISIGTRQILTDFRTARVKYDLASPFASVARDLSSNATTRQKRRSNERPLQLSRQTRYGDHSLNLCSQLRPSLQISPTMTWCQFHANQHHSSLQMIKSIVASVSSKNGQLEHLRLAASPRSGIGSFCKPMRPSP